MQKPAKNIPLVSELQPQLWLLEDSPKQQFLLILLSTLFNNVKGHQHFKVS
jgi:hypothetical protein